MISFTVFHVGGKGGIGEATNILKMSVGSPTKSELYIFEADLSDQNDLSENTAYIDKMKIKNIDVQILPYCMSDHVGEEDFYLMKDRWASSLFKIDPRAITYTFPEISSRGKHKNFVWQDHCSVDETRRVKVTTFDELMKGVLKKYPDFLSMDAQGSEYSILKGSSSILNNDLLGVITEVEFREIYDKQPLFADQDKLLRSNDFIFINFMTTQEWFVGPQIGKRFFTVGEVLYLRDYMYFVNKYENDLNTLFPILFKLALSSMILGYTSYSYVIVDYIASRWKKECNDYMLSGDPLLNNISSFYDMQKIYNP